MNPRIRPVLTATLAFLAALFAIWALDRWIVRPAFVEIEQAQAFEDAARARGNRWRVARTRRRVE